MSKNKASQKSKFEMLNQKSVMKFSLLFILSIFLFSCQQKENKKPVYNSDSIPVKKNPEEKKEEENKQDGDTIHMNFMNEKAVFVADGSLDSIHPRIYVKFKNENPGELNAKIITPTGKGNIRFNQILFPDQTSDGPFGMDLNISLKQKGNYILVIGHSQMAENPYFGKFRVDLKNRN
jgi:hypothetical protein